MLRETLSFLRQLARQRRNLLTLVFFDFSQNFLASYLGFAWAFIGPVVMLSIMTLVFQLGFRAQPPLANPDIPFALWLACGMVPWLYFSEGLTSCSNSVVSYAFLVRKAMFRIAYLPLIRLLAAGFIHCGMLLFLCVALVAFGQSPSIYWLQWFIYVGLMFLLLLGIGWLTSAVAVFIPDISNVLGIVTTLGFWATPIFWNPGMLPEKWSWFFIINPAHYIVQGYRDSFLTQRWIWERPFAENAVFAVWLLVFLFAGSRVFKKLRPQFADVL